jgi:hypothetical protein
VLVGADLRIAPDRDVVQRRRRRQQVRLLVGLEVLARHPLGRRVPAHALLVGAPGEPAATSVAEIEQLLAGEAVVADIAHGALDARLVLGMPRPRRVNVEAARLRVLEEAVDDARLARIRGSEDRRESVRLSAPQVDLGW